MGKELDYSKLSDAELEAIASGDYSKLSDATLQSMAGTEGSKDDIAANRWIGAGLGASVGAKWVAPAVATKYAGAEVLNRLRPEAKPTVTVEAAPASYNTPHGVGTGAVKNAVHNVDEVIKNKAAQEALKTPGFASPGNSRLLMPENVAMEAERAAQAAQAQEAAKKASLLSKAKQLGVQYGAPTGMIGKVFNTAMPVLSLAGAGAQASDAATRLAHGDTARGIISGIGALGSAASAIPHPVTRYGGTALSLLAPMINYGIDTVYGREGYAHGGLVYLAEGGESNTGPFIGYPQITNKPRDPNFKRQYNAPLGYLDAILGAGPQTQNVLDPKAREYMDAYEKAEPYGIASMVAPMLGGPARATGRALAPKAAEMAENYLTRIGGIQHIMPPGMGGKAAHEIDKAAPIKLSDWAQNRMNEYIVPTQADRMGGIGGPSYSANQLARKEYENRAWGSGQPGTATMIANLAKDPRFGGVEKQNFMPLLGKENMHQSNQMIFDRMVDQFYKDPSKLPPDLAKTINDYMQSGGTISGKKSGFDPFPNFDIRDRSMIEDLGKTFENRKLIGQHAFGGEGIGGRKAQIIPYEQILKETMDPTVASAKTFSVGPRAFKLTGEVENVPRPDLNPAYPYQLFGKDAGVTLQPTPSELALIDFHNQWRKDTGKTMPLKSGALPKPGYFEHTLGYKTDKNAPRIYPRQLVTEDWIKELQRSGMADGGLVNANTAALNPLSPQPINPNLNRLPNDATMQATDAMGETDRQTAPGLQALIGYPR